MKQFLLALPTIAVVACGTDASYDDPVSQAQAVLDICTTRYEELTDEPLATEADQALVRIGSGITSVLVTHGETGFFGPQLSDYYSVFGCIVSNDAPNDVRYLEQTLREPLIGIEDDLSSPEMEIAEGSPELLFHRDGRRFSFITQQEYWDKNWCCDDL